VGVGLVEIWVGRGESNALINNGTNIWLGKEGGGVVLVFKTLKYKIVIVG